MGRGRRCRDRTFYYTFGLNFRTNIYNSDNPGMQPGGIIRILSLHRLYEIYTGKTMLLVPGVFHAIFLP
jgi:hypothetical protein